MIIKRITILSLLFIFCLVIQVWADPSGTFKGIFGQENIKMKKLGEGYQPGISYKDDEAGLDDSFLGNPGANKRFSLVDSIDRIFSLYKVVQTTWRYKFFDRLGIKEIKSLNSEYGQSILKLHLNGNSYFEENGPQVTFEPLSSKLKRAEIFMFFHLSFNPKWEHKALEMYLIPSSDKGVNFFIPF